MKKNNLFMTIFLAIFISTIAIGGGMDYQRHLASKKLDAERDGILGEIRELLKEDKKREESE